MSAQNWGSRATISATPEHVMDTLTDTSACARWSPIPFEVDERADQRLQAGTTCRVSGRILGAPVRFRLLTLEAGARRLRLHARGPIEIHVAYALTPLAEGCDVSADVSIRSPSHPLGRLVGRAAALMLAAGTLDVALHRIAREAELSARSDASAHAPAPRTAELES
jgi:Polyketide cyclase / dehydrase and lipid transport